MKKTTLLLALLFTFVGLQAINLPDLPNPARLVNDFAGLLPPDQQNRLEQKLTEFDQQTSTQICLLTVADLQGLDKSDYAAQVFDKWGIGRNEKNNGILILIKPKTEASSGEIFIAVGYGLEGVVPDALAGRIIDYDILPAFRAGDYTQGVDNAVNTLIGLTQGEFTAESYLSKHEEHDKMLYLIAIFFMVAIVFTILGKSHKGHTISSSSGIPPIFFGGFGGNHRSSGGFSGFSGGGGFGGFGGGLTGGGGAGGSW